MPGKRVLQRLLRIRELQEEQSRVELEAAVGHRNRVADELVETKSRQAQGRSAFVAGISDRDRTGRAAGMIEMEQARKEQPRIATRLEAANAKVERQRNEFLEHRTARRQVETLVSAEQAALREEAARRAQQTLDDWYGRRGSRKLDRIGIEDNSDSITETA
jgi:flagellar export protein FliJ